MFDRCYSYDKDSLAQCKTRYLWVLNAHCDYSSFDFSWEPAPWESKQTHIWPSQHQEHSGTMLVPKEDAIDKNYNHPMVQRKGSEPRLHIKHMPDSADAGDINTRYISDYLGTMRRVLRKVDWQYCWVTTDICDYKHFDFTWHPSEYQSEMLHVFSSNELSSEQKFGDTFYVHVPTFLAKTENLKLLEWFETLHFIEASVPRVSIDFVSHESDSVIDPIWQHEFHRPVAVFSRYDYHVPPCISLWQPQTKTVVPLTKGSSSVLIPREVKNHLKTQVYDYPYINKKHPQSESESQDVVFISNGEPMAEENWQLLRSICPRAKRSDGVDGREAAYKTAAQMSQTDWFFAVFAKTEVLKDFTFEFQPDRLQEPKHYIFHSRNPLNGLEYGAMNINLYNVKLVMDTKPGLDFTLSQLHTVVPEVASISRFNTDPWITWRSAFREVLKLKLEVDQGAGFELQHRLKVWCERAVGDNADYCLQGANDALEYYMSVDGDYEMLKLSFDWPWLQQFYLDKHEVQLW